MQGRRWALKELQQYPLICLGSETMTYAFYNQFYLSNNLVLQPDTEAATTDQVVPLVKAGWGWGMCRRILPRTPWPRGMCLPSS